MVNINIDVAINLYHAMAKRGVVQRGVVQNKAKTNKLTIEGVPSAKLYMIQFLKDLIAGKN